MVQFLAEISIYANTTRVCKNNLRRFVMKNPIGSVVVIIGAILGALGIFLPFVKLEVAGVDLSTNVFRAICIVWLALAAAAVGLSFIGQKILTLIAAILAGGGFLISFFVNSGDISDLGDTASKGLGYWFLLVGGIVMILSGIIYFVTCKSENKDA